MKKLFENVGKNCFKILSLNESHLYSPVTLKMDSMGALHMWKGKGVPVKYSKYELKMDGKSADVYIQNSYNVDQILNDLSEEEKDAVKNGYHITTTNISDEYFLTK